MVSASCRISQSMDDEVRQSFSFLCEVCLYPIKSNNVRKNVEREFQSISLYLSSKMNLWQMVKLNKTVKHFQK